MRTSPNSRSEPRVARRVPFAMLCFTYSMLLQDLLDALCHAAVKKLDKSHNVEKLNVILRSMLTCLGQIRYRPRKLLDKIASTMIEEKNQLDNRDLLAFVVTTGTLNYAPQNSDKLYSVICIIIV